MLCWITFKYSLCLLTLLQFRKASITLCDQTDMLKWDHKLILGFRELSSVSVPVPRLFQDTRKYDLFLRNSTCSKILSLGHSSDSAFIQDFACRITFFSYATVDAPFKGLIVCTISKALLGSQTRHRDRDFSWARKPVSLTCSEILQKCGADTETQTTELLFIQDAWNPPPAARREVDLCLLHFPTATRRRRISPRMLRKQN